jgi:hypothetical protein
MNPKRPHPPDPPVYVTKIAELQEGTGTNTIMLTNSKVLQVKCMEMFFKTITSARKRTSSN